MGFGCKTREELLNSILHCYEGCYDIEKYPGNENPLFAKAVFHEHRTGYILVKKAEMWSMERHEFCYIFSLPKLTKENFLSLAEQAKEEGMRNVKAEKGHMCTNIVALFITDSADGEAVKELKKYKYSKSFMLSIRGWAVMHTALCAIEDDTIVSNGAGRGNVKFLQDLVHPKEKKKKKVSAFSVGM